MSIEYVVFSKNVGRKCRKNSEQEKCECKWMRKCLVFSLVHKIIYYFNSFFEVLIDEVENWHIGKLIVDKLLNERTRKLID